MKDISLWFTDFYDGFNRESNPIINILHPYFNISLDKNQPDYLIYSCHGDEFLKYENAIRIYYTGENLIPDFNLCDYAIGFSHLDFGERYLRYPNFALIEDQFQQLLEFKNFTSEEVQSKDYFCNFIYANANADPARDRFFQLLNNYKPVISPGKHLNNASFPVGERFSHDWMYTKLEFQQKCKFTIAFENSSAPGYTTEKLMHAFISKTIPIYWGNPDVATDFNPDAFINCHNFNNFEEVIERVEQIDSDDKLYLSILKEPAFPNNQIPPQLNKKLLQNFLINIFRKEKTQAFQRSRYGAMANYEQRLRTQVESKNRVKNLSRYLKSNRLKFWK